jgi:hypothetical protein
MFMMDLDGVVNLFHKQRDTQREVDAFQKFQGTLSGNDREAVSEALRDLCVINPQQLPRALDVAYQYLTGSQYRTGCLTAIVEAKRSYGVPVDQARIDAAVSASVGVDGADLPMQLDSCGINLDLVKLVNEAYLIRLEGSQSVGSLVDLWRYLKGNHNLYLDPSKIDQKKLSDQLEHDIREAYGAIDNLADNRGARDEAKNRLGKTVGQLRFLQGVGIALISEDSLEKLARDTM